MAEPRGVRMSPELQRIFDLPVKRPWTPEELEELRVGFTEHLLNDVGKAELKRVRKLPPKTQEKERERLRKAGLPIELNLAQTRGFADWALLAQIAGTPLGSVLAAPVGTGKCSSVNTPMRDPRTGRYTTAADVIARTLDVDTHEPNKGVFSTTPSAHVLTGTKDCVEVTLACGRTIVVTPEHPLRCPHDWVTAGDLTVGATVAIPGRLPEPYEVVALDERELDAVAILFTQGSCSRSTIHFSTADDEVVARMHVYADSVNQQIDRKSKYDYVVHGKKGNKNSPVLNLVRREEINCLSKHKRLPKSIWSLPDAQLARFLGVVIMCDGYVSKGGSPGITLASKDAIRELQSAFLRLGVQTNYHYKCAKYNGKSFDSWRLTFASATLKAFTDQCAAHMWGEKRARLTAARAKHNPNQGLPRVPADWAKAQFKDLRLTTAGGKQRRAYDVVCANPPENGLVTIGASLKQLGNERPELQWLLSGEVYWSRVVSVKPVGPHEVCDFTVPGSHCFIAADIVCHNTLFTYCFSTLMFEATGSRRSLLLVSGSGEEQTHEDFSKISTFWRSPATPQVATYQWLGQPGNGFRLCNCDLCLGDPEDGEVPDTSPLLPDFIIPDEADKLRNLTASVTKRVRRYMVHHGVTMVEGGHVRFAPMTGSFMRKSLKNFKHLFQWALGIYAPVPSDWQTTEAMCSVIDISVKDGRLAPGALKALVDPTVWAKADPSEYTHLIRAGYQKRMADTPGVTIIRESSCDKPLSIEVLIPPIDVDAEPSPIDREFLRAAVDGTTIDNWPLVYALDKHRYFDALGTGHVGVWDPRPPDDWCAARRAWLTFVNDEIDASQRKGRRPLDSPSEVERKYRNHPLLLEWRRLEPTFEPNPVDVELSTEVLEYAAKLIREGGPMVVWSQHDWVGSRLAEMTGLEFFGSQGYSPEGNKIDECDGSRSVIASAFANNRQRNLQYAFHDNLVIAPEPSGAEQEQKIGRTHRFGQPDRVRVRYLATSWRSFKSIAAMLEEARGQVTIGMDQKLLLGNWTPHPRVSLRSDDNERRARWHMWLDPDEDREPDDDTCRIDYPR